MKSPPFLFDLHVHTPFSDAQIPIPEMMRILIKRRVKIVGFADHVNPAAIYMHPPSFGSMAGVKFCYTKSILEYRREYIQKLNSHYKEISILHSGEVDMLPGGSLTLPKGITPDFFRGPGSYLMVVKHHLFPKPLNFLYMKRLRLALWMWQHNPKYRLHTRMFEKGLYWTLDHYRPDILAHPQENVPSYMSENNIRRFMLNLKKYNVAFELNHFDTRPKHKVFFLEKYLKWGEKYGVTFSIGSDFHGFQIDNELDSALVMLDLAKDWNLNLIDPRKFLSEAEKKKLFF